MIEQIQKCLEEENFVGAFLISQRLEESSQKDEIKGKMIHAIARKLDSLKEGETEKELLNRLLLMGMISEFPSDMFNETCQSIKSFL